MIISFTGVPPKNLIRTYSCEFPQAKWLDLDVPLKNIDRKKSVIYIPETTCSIIQTIIANFESIKPDILLATVGACKCDSMRYIIPILQRISPKTKIVECENNDADNYGTSICESGIPLKEKFNLITSNVTRLEPYVDMDREKPTAGFWGVPPYDYKLLDLFPSSTHVFGWTRCMENKTPHNPKLESYVTEGLPTVFFSQSFCPKNVLAKELAYINKGLYLETDGKIDKSTIAKVTAFLELKNCY